MFKRFRNQSFRWVALILGLWLAWDLLSHLIAESLWFQEVNYLPVFLKRLQTQLVLLVIVGSVSAGFAFGNLWLARQFQYQDSIVIESWLQTADNKPVIASKRLSLRSLLPVLIGLSLLLGVMLLYYSTIAVSMWHRDLSLPSVMLPQPTAFDWLSAQQVLLQQIPQQLWQVVVLGFIVIALVANPQFWLGVIALVLSLFWALMIAGQWGRVLQYFNATAFNADDSLLGRDISFYIFRFPVWQLLDFWWGGLVLFSLIAVILIYLVSGNSLSEGKFPGFSQPQLRHLYGLGSALAAVVAFHYWLARYELLYSPRGVVYGAGYTAVNAELPANTGLSILAGAIAIILILRTIFGFRYSRMTGQTALIALGLYIGVVVVVGGGIPAAVQRFGVQPNELAREQPYIKRNIALTRAAFDLEDINAETFNPQGQLNTAVLAENDLTIRNIRLWDTRPILQTNRQLQRIRLYYEFPDADIDRYTLPVEATGISPLADEQDNSQAAVTPDFVPEAAAGTISTERQQVLIAARELDYESVPDQAKTWVNKHLTYTHGYGFTLSPVNTVAQGGLPAYFVKDIGTATDENGGLTTSSELIRQSIPISRPRIYYGEITNTYVMTSTRVREFDYPSGDENVYNTYDGNGGIAIGSVWRRVLFAQYLKDWQMLLTRNFTPQTKVLFRRNINQRIRAIAPFLRYDSEPYLVTADAGQNAPGVATNYLYWIVDAYTTSDRYPYSDPGANGFNYIRNSVKVVIDAYHGDVTFYVADAEDPIIQTWSKIFPSLFKPLDAMPVALQAHIRYPLDFFSVQSERLLTYHMTDPQVFYNREDLWRIPQEIYGTESQAVEPYYLIMRLPTATSEEFILLHPYTPVSRTNLIGWLAARSDGEQYGNLLLYQFPKQQLIFGPEQIEALINQDPIISEQISLWNRQGSRAIQGNLLVIPIEQSLLYVEPLYLEAERNSLPTLVRVIVVYENRIVMADTLEQALQAIFQPGQPEAETIIRPVEGLAQP